MLWCKTPLYYNGIKNAILVSRTRAKVSASFFKSFKTTGIHRQLESKCLSRNSLSFNIKRNCKNYPAKESTILESNIELDDIELFVSSEAPLSFNLTWLRDSCHCNSCTHQYSRQRLFTVKDFKRDKFLVKGVRLLPESRANWIHAKNLGEQTSDSCICVSWSDGHDSLYSLNWLRYIDSLNKTSHLDLRGYPKTRLNFPNDDLYLPSKAINLEPVYWDVETIQSNLTKVNYEDLTDGFEFKTDAAFINANCIADMSQKRINALLSLSQQLVRFGLAKITNVPLERNQVLNIARSLAYEKPTGYGTVFDVVIEPSEEINLAYSSLEFDLHSDLTYRETSPGVQLLHCIRDSTVGGLSYFSDAHKAASLLREMEPNLFQVLVQIPTTFIVRDPYRNIKFRHRRTVLTLDHEGHLSDIYYSPFMLPPIGCREDVKLFYLALDKFTKLLQSPSNKYITKMNPGELFIFHNRRVLHGRSAYDATTEGRFLQGCYMDWDEIEGLYEKLYSNNGFSLCNQ